MKQHNGMIAVLTLMVVCLGCDGASRVGGTVVDANGRPIENASVLFEAVEKGDPKDAYQCTVKTSPQGTFGCGFVHAPRNVKLRLTIEKEGYAIYARELYSSDFAKSPGGNIGSQVITLEPR